MADLMDKTAFRQALVNRQITTRFFDIRERQEIGCIIEMIDSAPAVDAVAVVRCGKCKHYVEAYKGAYGGDCALRECITDNTDYCSYGERREEDEKK